MLRALRSLAGVLITLAVTAPALADEATDVQQIHNLFTTIWAAQDKGDPRPALAGFAPDAVFYYAAGQRPELWGVAGTGTELTGMIEADTRNSADTWARHPDWSHGAEVLHVNVKSDHAIVLTQKWQSQPDSVAREDVVTTYQEVAMLAKIGGAWKITAGIETIDYAQQVIKWGAK